MAQLLLSRLASASLNRFGEVMTLEGGEGVRAILRFPGEAPLNPLGSEVGAFSFRDQVDPVAFVLPEALSTLAVGLPVTVRGISMAIARIVPQSANGFHQVDLAIPSDRPTATRYR